MKKQLLVFVLMVLISCREKPTTESTHRSGETVLDSISKPIAKKRIPYENLAEIVGESSSVWAKKQDSTSSLAIHFQYKDTLLISYSTECYFLFPYTLNENKVTVYWDHNIDTKYKFDLVNAMQKVDKNFIGQPFMTLELDNATTLKAEYLEKDLIKNLNKVSTERLFFPSEYKLIQQGEYYN